MIKFVEDENPKKLKVVGVSTLGKEWVSQLKVSSRRITKGSEPFVIKAFNEYKKGIGVHRKTIKEKLAAAEPAIAKALANAMTKDPGPLKIVECSMMLQKIWGLNLKDCLTIKIMPDSTFKATITVAKDKMVITGCGYSVKNAKEAAANHFIREIRSLTNNKNRKEQENV